MRRFAVAICLAALTACASPDASQPLPPTAPPAAAPLAPELSMEPAEVAFRDEAETARRLGLPILIQERGHAGGRFRVTFYNISGTEFTDMVFQLTPYDSFGRIAGPAEQVRFRGPVRASLSLADGLLEGVEDELWAAAGIACVEITALELGLPDGARARFDFDSVTRMYREGVDKWCRFAA